MKMTKIMAAVMSVVMLLACTAFSASAANVVALADLTPQFINLEMTKSGADDLGVTLAGPWQTTEGWGYTYWPLTWAQIEETPYIVIDIADDTVALLGGWCDLSLGWVNQSVYNFRPAAGEAPTKQVVDMRTLVEEGSDLLCFCVTTSQEAAPLVFDAAYLTDDPDATAGGNTETGVESAVAVAAAAVIGAGALMFVSRKK